MAVERVQRGTEARREVTRTQALAQGRADRRAGFPRTWTRHLECPTPPAIQHAWEDGWDEENIAIRARKAAAKGLGVKSRAAP